MARARMAFEQLRHMLNDKELDEILAATREFRERFDLR